METKTETKAKQAKQITVNVSETDKGRVNQLKEELGLTDKELVSVLLEVVGSTEKDVITSLVEKVQREKAIAAVQARLSRLTEKKAELEKELESVGTAETPLVVE